MVSPNLPRKRHIPSGIWNISFDLQTGMPLHNPNNVITPSSHSFIYCLERVIDILQTTMNFDVPADLERFAFFCSGKQSTLVNNLLNQMAATSETLDLSQRGICSGICQLMEVTEQKLDL